MKRGFSLALILVAGFQHLTTTAEHAKPTGAVQARQVLHARGGTSPADKLRFRGTSKVGAPVDGWAPNTCDWDKGKYTDDNGDSSCYTYNDWLTATAATCSGESVLWGFEDASTPDQCCPGTLLSDCRTALFDSAMLQLAKDPLNEPSSSSAAAHKANKKLADFAANDPQCFGISYFRPNCYGFQEVDEPCVPGKKHCNGPALHCSDTTSTCVERKCCVRSGGWGKNSMCAWELNPEAGVVSIETRRGYVSRFDSGDGVVNSPGVVRIDGVGCEGETNGQSWMVSAEGKCDDDCTYISQGLAKGLWAHEREAQKKMDQIQLLLRPTPPGPKAKGAIIEQFKLAHIAKAQEEEGGRRGGPVRENVAAAVDDAAPQQLQPVEEFLRRWEDEETEGEKWVLLANPTHERAQFGFVASKLPSTGKKLKPKDQEQRYFTVTVRLNHLSKGGEGTNPVITKPQLAVDVDYAKVKNNGAGTKKGSLTFTSDKTTFEALAGVDPLEGVDPGERVPIDDYGKKLIIVGPHARNFAAFLNLALGRE